jgi:putative ABC transport system permease protein
MMWHDLVIAVRRIARQPAHAALSAGVLALGIVCLLAAYVFVSYLRSYDRSFANHARTYVIAQSTRSRAGGSVPFMNQSALVLADHLRADFPDLPSVARYAFRSFMPIGPGPDATPRLVSYAEPEFLAIFDLTPVAGEVRSALSEPRSVVLTKDAADSLFGTTDVVGKTLTLHGREAVDATVRAVVAELPRTSHLARRGLFTLGFEVLASWDLFDLLDKTTYANSDSWGYTAVLTYVLTPPDGSISRLELDRRLAALAERNAPQGYTFALLARPISEITTSQLQQAFEGYSAAAPWRVDIFALLMFLAGAILVIACLNFVNLATAQPTGRAIDIGTRKALGATSVQIVRQDLMQTALVVAAAIAMSLSALVPIRRAFEAPYGLALEIPWTQPRIWAFLATLLVGVTLAAGLYPAFVLARMRAAGALRPGTASKGARQLRTALVGLQFGTATLLLVFVIVVVQQGDTIREAALGRFVDQYIGLFMNGEPGALSPTATATEIARNPRVRGVTTANIPPFMLGSLPRNEYAHTAEDLAPHSPLQRVSVGYDYFTVLEMRLLAGRAFSEDRADDALPTNQAERAARGGKPIAIVLDRAGARALGWLNPVAAVGQTLFEHGVPAGAPVPQYEIIGVVENATFNVRDQGTQGTGYLLNPKFANFVLVRFGKNDTTAVLADLDATFKKLSPGRPPPSKMFIDDMFENAYWTFRLMNRVLMGLAVFALAIAGIGLFGLASYVTRARTREIGLRKTQGASPARIVRLLLWDFSRPVVVANVLAWPLAYYLAERYIAVFSARMALTPLPFVAAFAGTLALAVVTVGARALHASRLRPTDALRHD